MNSHSRIDPIRLAKPYANNMMEDDDSDLEEEKDEEEIGELGFKEVHVKKIKANIDDGFGSGRRGSSSAAASVGGRGRSPPCCQVEECDSDMRGAKQYHRRHRVCEVHAKAPVVRVAGLRQRFCQQCSRFHELSEFDEEKKSCRRRLAGHNERRRKISSESHRDRSRYTLIHRTEGNQYKPAGDGRDRPQMAFHEAESSSCNNLHIHWHV